MIESLKTEVKQHGNQVSIVPVSRLQDLQQDVEALKGREDLNNFQKYILSGIYNLSLPDTGYEIRSMVMVASPSPSCAKFIFHWQGKQVMALLPASYIDKDKSPRRIEAYLKAFLNPKGYHVTYAPQLPHKLLAVRSGLGKYGRNNICYVEGMGSFLNLNPFFADIPCTDDTWHEITQMDLCHTCQACLQHCPTGAILPTRFLIDNERCLTYFNEAGAEWNFPDWINPKAHHTLYGCLRCQYACPVDKAYLNEMDPVEFSEEETDFLIEMKTFDEFPEHLKQRITEYEMTGYLGAIPRNLRALFHQLG